MPTLPVTFISSLVSLIICSWCTYIVVSFTSGHIWKLTTLHRGYTLKKDQRSYYDNCIYSKYPKMNKNHTKKRKILIVSHSVQLNTRSSVKYVEAVDAEFINLRMMYFPWTRPERMGNFNMVKVLRRSC